MRSRSTTCSAGHDGDASSGASNSFSIQAEYRFSVARSQVSRSGQTLPGAERGRGGSAARTAIGRVIVLHSPGAWSRASFACHVPAAGDATSANQKYGGPPWRSRDLAATLPSGAISESSPSSGFSAAKMTRRGAPFHGATGEGKTASSAASSQLPGRPCACASRLEKQRRKTRLRSAAMPSRRSKPACWKQLSPLPRSATVNIGKLGLNHGEIHCQWNCRRVRFRSWVVVRRYSRGTLLCPLMAELSASGSHD